MNEYLKKNPWFMDQCKTLVVTLPMDRGLGINSKQMRRRSCERRGGGRSPQVASLREAPPGAAREPPAAPDFEA